MKLNNERHNNGFVYTEYRIINEMEYILDLKGRGGVSQATRI